MYEAFVMFHGFFIRTTLNVKALFANKMCHLLFFIACWFHIICDENVFVTNVTLGGICIYYQLHTFHYIWYIYMFIPCCYLCVCVWSTTSYYNNALLYNICIFL